MMKMQLMTATALSAGLLAVNPAHAAITFVDATADTGPGTGNTTLNGAEIVFSGPGQNATSDDVGTDGFWGMQIRPDANGGEFFALADGEVGDGTLGAAGVNTPQQEGDIVPLRISTNVDDGLYNVYGLFYNGSGGRSFTTSFSVGDTSNFQAFTGGTNSSVTAMDAPEADSADYTTPIEDGFSIGTIAIELYQANLGQFQVSGGELVVFVSSQNELIGTTPPSGIQRDERAWFEGIGFEVVPEPSSLALLGLGGLALLNRRRQA